MRNLKLLLFTSVSCLALAMSSRADVPVVVDVIPATNSVVSSLTQIEIFFSEDVLGVDAADLLVNGVPANDVSFGLPGQAVFRFTQPANGPVTISWALDHGITDTALVPNNFAGGGWTYTLDPTIAPPTIVINEFLANNSGYSGAHPNNIRDEDGDGSDWIELFNAGALSVNLDGWFLTDESTNLMKWRIPAVTMLSSNYMVIFASGKDRANTTNFLHTNFKLSTSPSFLALVKPDGMTIASTFAPHYPQQSIDVSYGRAAGMLDTLGYFTVPTPGKANSTSGSGFAPEIVFSVPSMTFTGTFQLALSLAVPTNAEIRYTLNGAIPTNGPGAGSLIYSSALTITNTARVRARAFQANTFPGPIHSEHYIALSPDVLNYTTDLPIIILHNYGGGAVPSGSDQFMFMSVHEPKNGLSSLTNAPDLTSRGIFHLRGSSTLNYAKGSFHLETQDEFGLDKHVPLLGMPGQSDWAFYAPNNFEPILFHNPLAYELSRQIGRYASRTRFAVVYLKDDATIGPVTSADYNGIYVVEEQIKRDKNRVDIDEPKPENIKPPEITGGYMLSIDRGDGSTALSAGGASMNWIDPHGPEMNLPQRKPQRDYLTKYFNDFQASQAGNGWTNRTTGYWAYLDVDAAIDHSVHNVFTFNVDALRLSGYFYKPRNGKITYGPVWDFDRTLNSTDGRDQNPRVWRSASGDQGTDFFGNGTQPWWDRFFVDPDFWQKWIDRWQELRQPGMPFHNASLSVTVDKLANQVRHEHPRELAKWNIAPRNRGTTYPHETNYNGTYQGEVNALKAWLADRGNFFDTNFLAQPVLSSAGGPISSGFVLSMTAPVAGTNASIVYYTLDGTDPRAPGGAIAPNALPYTGPITINANARVVARAFNDSRRNLRRIPAPADPGSGNPQITSPWSGPVAATFVVTTPKLVITEIMYHPADPPAGSPYVSDDFEFIELKNTGTTPLALGGIQLNNGIQFSFDATRYITPGADTVQTFDGGGTTFAPSQLGTSPGAAVTLGGPRGSFMRLLSQASGGGKNRIAFDKTASGPYDSFTADFDFRGTTAGSVITTGTPTIQNFEVPGTGYTLSNYNGAAAVLATNTPPLNRFLRLTPNSPTTTINSSNIAVFDRTAIGAFNLVVATFDFRINPSTPVTNAPGFGFAFLNTTTYGIAGVDSGNLPGFAEEPNLPDAIGVGFDTFLDLPASSAEPNNNHVSLHYNGAQVSPVAATPSFDFSNNQFHRAQVMIRFADGNAYVSVRLTQNVNGTNLPPEAVFENFAIPGVAPFEGRIAFGARTSNKLAQQEVDNIDVEYFNVPASAGLSLVALPAATFGASGTGSGLANYAQEPRAPGVFAVDLTMNPSPFLNHVTAYWNSNQAVSAFVPPASVDLDSGVFHHAHLEVLRGSGASTVNLTLTPDVFGILGNPVTVLSNYVVNGLDLGDSRIELAGRSGELNVGLDLDNLAVHYLQLIPNVLAAGESLVLVKNTAAFQSRYGTGIRIGGEYAGALNNNGNRLTLVGGLGEPILDFSYSDSWYPATDGSGFSLVIANDNAPLNTWGLASSWRPSTEPLGSPGGPGAVAPNLPVIYVNEAMTHTVLPQLDQIELYNPNNFTVDISGWYLTDDFNKPKKFRIPSSTTILANSYQVFTELQFNAGPNAFALGAKGDSVYLFSGNSIGDLTGYVHGFDFGAAPLGQSFGRYVTSIGEDHFVAQISPTFNGTNAGPLVGPVVVSEIMYHPADLFIFGNPVDDKFGEFIELKNVTGGPVNLFDPANPANTWRLRDAVSFHFPTNVTLPAGGFALVASFDPADSTMQATFRTRFSVPDSVKLFGPWEGNLDNSSASVELTRPDAPEPPPADASSAAHILVDKVRYSPSSPWLAADGTLLSLHRINPSAYGNDPVNWTAAGPSAGVAFLGGPVPVITASPTNQTVIGSLNLSATFSVSATSPTPLGYQWQFNGVNLPGATSSILTVTDITPDDAGSYQVVVYNGGGFAYSDMAKLTVLLSATITRQPTNQVVRLGTNVTFVVVATSTTPLHYQWQYNGADIPNATSSTYVINNVQVLHEGNYSVMVRDDVGTVPSAVARLTVLVASFYTQQPQSVIAVQGDTVNFSMAVNTTTHPLPISFKWRINGATVNHRPPGTNITIGDFASTLTLKNVQPNQAGAYTMLITNVATPPLLSSAAALTVLLDADGDHIPDDWEIANGFDKDNPADATQDADGDGFSNLQEYIAGTDPHDATSYLKVDSITGAPGTATLTFIARSNKTYTVLFKNSLSDANWQSLSNLFARATNRMETITDASLGNGSRVYRLITPYQQ